MKFIKKFDEALKTVCQTPDAKYYILLNLPMIVCFTPL